MTDAGWDDLTLTIQRALDRLRDANGQPVWEPLEAVVPAAWLDGWMWMGADQRHDPVVFRYKHGITRRYLYVGADLSTFEWSSDTGYRPIGREVALERAYHGIEAAGATRETAYDDDYRATKHAALREAGFDVIT